nr:serine/threonine-protein kinase [Gemmatimonadaceae bacterium]
VERFKQEIATLATLQHPQLVPVYSAGSAGDLLYYAMPFIAGESLRERLTRDGPLPGGEVRRVLIALARALAYAHREGIIHRDIKPENILLAHGEPMLADFGIAKVLRDGVAHGTLTSAGMSIGTVTYMAPEQVVADPTLDGRADVYSLAAVGYELLAGVPPFEGTPQQVMSAHVVKPVPPLPAHLPKPLREVVLRGLAKEPAERVSAAEFAQALEAAGAAEVTETRTAARSARAASAWRRPWLLAAGAALVVAGAVFWGQWRSGTSPPARAIAAMPEEQARSGIAVLPFEQIGAADDAYLAAGLTDELMTQLAAVPALRVASRTTVRAYADSALPPDQLGARLQVRALIEGSVQRMNDQLRVSTRLVDVRDGGTIWTERYDRQATDLFTVQRDIGTAVVAALAPRLGLSLATASPRVDRVADAAAYEAYLRGRFALQQRGEAGLREAIARFSEATTRDTTFARAYAGIAEAAALLPQYSGRSYDAVADQLRSAAARALALDSTLAEPHTALGVLARAQGDHAAAEAAFRRAVARQPDSGPAHQALGELEFVLGRVDAAVASLGAAALREPASTAIQSEFGFSLVLAGALDSARRVIDRAIARDASNGFSSFARAVLLERLGDLAGAQQAMAEAGARLPLPFFAGAEGWLAARRGDAAALAAARARVAAGRGRAGHALGEAMLALFDGTPDTIIASLSAAASEGDPIMRLLPLRLPWFDRLRSEPGFRALAVRLRLPETAIAALPAPARR